MKTLLLLSALLLAGCAGTPIKPRAKMSPWPYTWTVPGTGSMRPMFNDGDTAVCVAGDFAKIKRGDVVMRGNVQWSPSPSGLIFHVARYQVPGGGWVTQGLNCTREDPGVMVRDDFCGFVYLVSKNPHPTGHRVAMGLRQ